MTFLFFQSLNFNAELQVESLAQLLHKYLNAAMKRLRQNAVSDTVQSVHHINCIKSGTECQQNYFSPTDMATDLYENGQIDAVAWMSWDKQCIKWKCRIYLRQLWSSLSSARLRSRRQNVLTRYTETMKGPMGCYHVWSEWKGVKTTLLLIPKYSFFLNKLIYNTFKLLSAMSFAQYSFAQLI